MALSGFFLFSARGETLTAHVCRSNIKPSVADIFRIQVLSNPSLRSPILTLGSTTFLHVKHNDIWLVAVTRSNADAGVVFEWLYAFLDVLKSYFGSQFDEDVVKCYPEIIYALLDETLENGMPQSLELSHLKSLVKQPPQLLELLKKTESNHKSNNSAKDIKYNKNTKYDANTPWRPQGLKYRRNEIFLDVHEAVNVLISSDGKILKSYIDGRILMKTQLSGMPVCDFGLNDTLSASHQTHGDMLSGYDVKNPHAIPSAASVQGIVLEDPHFHPCVQLDKFDNDRVIQFIPPDGEFELMTYRTTKNINFPFKLTPSIRVLSGGSSYEIKVSLKSLFPSKLNATDVLVTIPVHSSSIDAEFASSGGKAKFLPSETAITWSFKKFSGLTEHSLTASVKCANSMVDPLDLKKWQHPAVRLAFEVLMFSSSGVVVEHLRVRNGDSGKVIKWVRYICRAGSYEMRC